MVTIANTRWLAVAALLIFVALSACSQSTSGTSTIPQNLTVESQTLPGHGQADVPNSALKQFRRSNVRITQIAVPVVEEQNVRPFVLAASSTGMVYFGQSGSFPNPRCPPNIGCDGSGPSKLIRFEKGQFLTTDPHGPQFTQSYSSVYDFYCVDPSNPPKTGCVWQNNGGVGAIDTDVPGSVLWSSSYCTYLPCIPFGELEYGGSEGAATIPPSSYDIALGYGATDAQIISIVTARNGRLWIGGGGPGGAAGNPAQIPGYTSSTTNNYDYLLLANGPDKNVWGIAHLFINTFKYTTIFEFAEDGSVLHAHNVPSHIMDIAGSNDALWFVDRDHNAIGRLSKKGTIREYAVPTQNSGLTAITLAADGSHWFTESLADKVGRIDKRGHIVEFQLAAYDPGPIAANPDSGGCNPNVIWVGEVGYPPHLAQITY